MASAQAVFAVFFFAAVVSMASEVAACDTEWIFLCWRYTVATRVLQKVLSLIGFLSFIPGIF